MPTAPTGIAISDCAIHRLRRWRGVLGSGARLSLSLGHHFSKSDRMRFVCEGVIERLSDGAYHMRDQDLHVRMGPTAIIITDPMYNSP